MSRPTPPLYNPTASDKKITTDSENESKEERYIGTIENNNQIDEIEAIIANKRRLSETLIESSRKLSESSRSKISEIMIESKRKESSSSLSLQTLKEFANSSYRASGANVIIEPEEIAIAREKSFIFSHGLTSIEADIRLQKFGRNELPEKIIPKWYIFLSQLWQPMPIMIWIAIIIEAGIQNWIDMSILVFIQFANASIGYYEITKAGDAVAALKKSLKPVATVKRDGKFVNIDAAVVVPGDLVLLASGSAIPADSRVNEGEIEVDEAALTGESLPVTKFQGNNCLMGSTVVRGEVEGTVEFTGANTFFGKTAALLEVSLNNVCIVPSLFVCISFLITLLSLFYFYLFLYLYRIFSKQ
jgi:magnesium-transporting ATPase (P-type)